MSNTRIQQIAFGFVILLIIGIVGGLIYQQERILQRGTTTILQTMPIDPRDLFRGEYVVLRYQIEQDRILRDIARDAESGTAVYVRLQEDAQGIAMVAEAQLTPPDSYTDALWIRGIVRSNLIRFADLEQYYVPEGAGLPIERLGNQVHVEVALYQGNARIVNLLDAELQPIDPRDYIER